jgi:hypothetical protein
MVGGPSYRSLWTSLRLLLVAATLIQHSVVVRKDGPEDDSMAMAKAQTMYTKLFFVQIPLIQLGLSAGTYAAICYGLPLLGMPGMQAVVKSKIDFLAQHDLGWVYLAVYLVALGRDRIAANSNAVRAGARVDRPDQHVCEYHSVASCAWCLRGHACHLVVSSETGGVYRQDYGSEDGWFRHSLCAHVKYRVDRAFQSRAAWCIQHR